jgi:hypothetical protein
MRDHPTRFETTTEPTNFARLSKAVCQTLLLLVTIASLTGSAFAKRTDDVVVLVNGDRMTGEIKSLTQGVLSFKSEYMEDSVRLNWQRVSRIESKDTYLITLTTGDVVTGTLALSPRDNELAPNFVIHALTETMSKRQDEVIRILPLEARFIKRINGSIDYGYSYTSGNTQYNSQLSATANYREKSTYLAASGNVEFSGQRQGSRTSRKYADVSYRNYFRQKTFGGAMASFLSSEQQSLDLRTTLGGILGRSLLLTERTNISAYGGVAYTREHYTLIDLQEPHASNAEAVLGLDFYTFRFKITDISSRLIVYPSLTQPGRVRMSLDSNLKIEIFKDFYVGLNLYENFDSRPPNSTVKKNDLGISTSVGWKF